MKEIAWAKIKESIVNLSDDELVEEVNKLTTKLTKTREKHKEVQKAYDESLRHKINMEKLYEIAYLELYHNRKERDKTT